jgi:hypothetical protein
LNDARRTYRRVQREYLQALQAERARTAELCLQQGALVLTGVGDYERSVMRLMAPLFGQASQLSVGLTALKRQNHRDLAALEEQALSSSYSSWDHGNTSPQSLSQQHVKEGYLFRKRIKGIGLPWKRVYARVDTRGFFLLYPVHASHHHHNGSSSGGGGSHGHGDGDEDDLRPMVSVSVLLCQVFHTLPQICPLIPG